MKNIYFVLFNSGQMQRKLKFVDSLQIMASTLLHTHIRCNFNLAGNCYCIFWGSYLFTNNWKFWYNAKAYFKN